MRNMLLAVLLVLGLLSACSTTDPPPEAQAPTPGLITLDADCTDAPGLETSPEWWGTLTTDRSLYEVYLPANLSDFNGRLMLFAHGYFDPYAGSVGNKQHDYKNLFLPNHYNDPDDDKNAIAAVYNEVICSLIKNGFGFGWTSYNINGYAVKSGSESIQELRALAVDAINKKMNPATRKRLKVNRVYVMGFSLGGQVVATLMEKFPTSYDGALPMCGPVAGSTRQLAYIGDARAVFDYGFPGVLPGYWKDDSETERNDFPALSVPEPPVAWSTTVAAINTAFGTSEGLATAQKLANVTQVTLPYDSIDPLRLQLKDSWKAVLYFAARGVNNAMWLAGGNPYDNHHTSYSGLSTEDNEAINHKTTGVVRYEAVSAAVTYFKNNYDTTGNISRPVLTLHTNQDPAIPYWHTTEYGAKVKNLKKTSNLAQQYVKRYGHCNFKPEEVANALNSLITWAEAPSWLKPLFKPADGDVTR